MKKVKKSAKKFILILGLFLLVCVGVFAYLYFFKSVSLTIGVNVFEVNSEVRVSNLLNLVNGSVDGGDELIDTSVVGEFERVVTIKNQMGAGRDETIRYVVIDTTAPVIEGESIIEIKRYQSFDFTDYFSATDNSGLEPSLSLVREFDAEVSDTYGLKLLAIDGSGNTSELEFSLIVGEADEEIASLVSSGQKPYYIKVNRLMNVVMVYGLDEDGAYTRLVKTFVCSVGREGHETPLGTFTVSDRYETLYLVGDVWGHYTLRINGSIFFHSVPYFTKGEPWDDLEYEEYNKLGSGASAGCVRLAAADAKWIFDNIAYGTSVEIYDSEELPEGVVKPIPIKIDLDDERRGWDPTDPDEDNPW